MKLGFFCLLGLALSGCGFKNDETGMEILLDYPHSLRVKPARLVQLTKRAVRLIVWIDTHEGERFEYAFRYASRIRLRLTERPPAGSRIRVEIWDQKKDGRARFYPSLQGETLLENRPVQRILLQLNLPALEYDPPKNVQGVVPRAPLVASGLLPSHQKALGSCLHQNRRSLFAESPHKRRDLLRVE